MFGKILKYDFRAIGKLFLILALSSLGAAFVSGLCIRFSIDLLSDNDYVILGIMTLILAIFSAIAFVAAHVAVFILLFANFYRKFFSDEGYLTFTLPVSRKTLLFSKTLNASIWTLLSVFTLVIGIFIMMAVPAGDSLVHSFESLLGGTNVWGAVHAAEIILAILAIVLFSVVLVEFSITVGASIARRAKLFIGIAIWYGSNVVMSILMQSLTIIESVAISNMMQTVSVDKIASVQGAVTALLILLALIILCSLTYTLYCITLSLLERRLNLA